MFLVVTGTRPHRERDVTGTAVLDVFDVQGICNLSSSDGLLPSRCSLSECVHSGYVGL